MEPKKKVGIDITEADGTPLSCGLEFYWDAGLSQILMQEASDFCPDVEFNQKDERAFETRFHKDTEKGVELCGTSKSLENRRVRIPESDLDKFIDAIDQLHAKSERHGIPADNKTFMHDFVVPNPLSMKSAWRVTAGFTQRLLVLWGYTAPSSDAVILPLTPTSAKWDDASRRKDLKQLLFSAGLVSKHKFNWAKFFKWLLALLLILLLLLLLHFGIVGIIGHKCVTCNKEVNLSFKHFPYMCKGCSLPEKKCICTQPDQPGNTQPGSTPPGSTPPDQPGNTQPGSTPPDQQGSTQPDQPSNTQPGSTPPDQQGSTQPDQPNNTQPGNTQPGSTQPDQPGNTQPGSTQPDQPGTPQPGSTQPDQPGNTQPGNSQSGEREKVPAIADYTFSVQLKQKAVNGALVNATFIVVPDKCMGNTKFTVNSWLINGEPKQSGDMKTFSVEDLSYKKRYVITAIVTVNGKEQKVLPYQWNSIDTPVWMISRIGNKDNEYQMLCTNSSNTCFKVVKWSQPIFQNGKKDNISAKFKCAPPILIGDNKVRFTWSQDHMGEYIVTLEARVGIFSEEGTQTGETQVTNTFVFINGSRAQALISQKFDNAKDRIYHCLATNMDGTQHNGTAFAVTDKLLLTNYHVAVGNIPEYYRGEETKVDPSKLLVLSNEKGMFYAKVIKSDRATDMALLKLCDKNGGDTDAILPEYFFVAKSEPALNERVFSAGYPAGTTKFGEPAFSDGKIEHCETAGKRGEIICHFSNIQPGYSGGPLVYMDSDSVIIGVNSSGIATDTPVKQGVNVATSATEIRKKFPEIFSANR